MRKDEIIPRLNPLIRMPLSKSTRRYELVVFDWDGTLMDSAGLITRSIQAAARDLGLPVPDDATASHVIGLGLTDALALAVPQLAVADYPRMAERYRYHFLAGDTEAPLFAGTEVTCRPWLRSHDTTAATSDELGENRAWNCAGVRYRP